ncbi:MAG: CHASE2 domain-containing protein [Cyanobacteria bacterium P01_H01_bin.15]
MADYQVGGSLPQESPYYVKRRADRQLMSALQAGELCYVFNSRQMGKSSLMVQSMVQLQQAGYACAAVDMTRIGSELTSPEQWYKGIAVELWQGFDLLGELPLKTWWKEHQDLSAVQRLGQFLEQGILDATRLTEKPLVIFLDEIDSVLNLSFPVSDFFALLRACHNRRSLERKFRRLNFVLLGVATPTDLMSDPQRTPFNIGRAISLTGFDVSEAQVLAQGLTAVVDDPSATLAQILFWTNGQPFLTQKLCSYVVDRVHEAAAPKSSKISGVETVEHIVRQQLIRDWESYDQPEHFRTIRDRLLRNEDHAGRLLGLYGQIRQYSSENNGENLPPKSGIKFNDSREHLELLLSGLVVNEGETLVVKNPLYRAIFDEKWIQEKLADLRPYATEFAAWIASNRQDETLLLQGTRLTDALAWTLGKSLSTDDYQYLSASQAVAKRQVEQALTSVEQASYLLAETQKKAKRSLRKTRLPARGLISTILFTLGVLLVVRMGGVLQGLEYQSFDQFFRWRGLINAPSYITVVEIDEPTLQQTEEWPLSDENLLQGLQTIANQSPALIGLDIYRDLPVPPGHEKLTRFLLDSNKTIGIEKVTDPPVAPPPTLSKKGQVSFADQVLDSDGRVRRALLSLQDEQGDLHLSLGLRLALDYLATKAVYPESDSHGQIQLGQAMLAPLKSHDGGYVRADHGGFQIMLNYHGDAEQFSRVSFGALLRGDIPADMFRDRIVLVGSTAASLKDGFLTPLSRRWFQAPVSMPGVYIHANTVAQIVASSQQSWPILRSLNEWQEWLLIALYSLMGALTVWWRLRFRWVLSFLCGSTVLLTLGFYQAFVTAGWWLPLVPALIALWVTSLLAGFVTLQMREQLEFHQTWELLLAHWQEAPTTTRIAMEYLKLAQGKKNQQFIAQQLTTLKHSQ